LPGIVGLGWSFAFHSPTLPDSAPERQFQLQQPLGALWLTPH
jgi:hypothetical protein